MKIIIFVLLVSPVVLPQDITSHHQQYLQYSQQPTLEPAPARPEPIKRAGYSIRHGDAQSSVQVNLNSAAVGSLFHQPESIQLGAEDVSSGGLQFHGIQSTPQQEYFQGQEALVQYQAPQQSYLTDLANKQYLNINPNNVKSDIISQEQPQQQLYNVGYSINIENSAPKLSYRVPMPKNAHSYRQQKLLNAEVITGTHKGLVEKPNGYTQTNYDFAASNVQPSANYISADQGKNQYAPNFAEKQSLTKVYTDVKNTHGYTWKNVSPNVEISGYHSLNDMSQLQQTQAQGFDHAAALGRSQGFDMSNVVENGKTQYQPNVESQAYDINKALSEASTSNTQVTSIEAADNHGFDTSSINTASNGDSGGFSHGGDTTGIVDLKFDSPSQNSYPSYGGFSSQFKSGDLGFNSSPFKHNLLSSGSNIEFDKSLLDGFYKNYNPLFYQPEVTLPSPNLPKNININLHGAASHQFPTYNLKFSSPPSHFKNSISPPLSNPQLQMINQHYAFVQASEAEGQNLAPVNNNVKPVTEQQEDSQGQQSQQQAQQVAVQAPSNLNAPNPNFKEQKGKGNTEHKKYIPQGSPVPVSVRQYGRPVVYVNDKNYRMKTSLRPPPMIIIHQKY